MHSFLEDLRFAIRNFRGSPGLTVTAILTLAAGIAASTTVFGWVDGVLLSPLPGVSRGNELASLETVSPNGETQNTGYRDYRDYRDNLHEVSGLAASLANVFTVGNDQNAHLLWGEFVSSNYFNVMGVKARLGRTFLPEESGDAPGGPQVVIIADRLWETAFARDHRVIGRTLRVNQRELTVVGVLPPEFRGTVAGLALQMWVPLSLAPDMNGQGPWLLNDRAERQMWVTARLRPGSTMDRARAEVVAAAQRLSEAHPNTNFGFSATLLPISRSHLGAHHLLRTPLQILLAICLVLFFIVAANVTNLQLVRAAARQKEFGIRIALGARPLRLVRQLLTESLLLATLGATAGALLNMWLGQALIWLLPPVNLPIEFGTVTTWRTLVFMISISMIAAVLTGVIPALHSIRASAAEDLKENSRGSTAGISAGRTRKLLVATEVALAMVALVGTGALARTFFTARAIDHGMNANNVACAKYYLETFCRTGEERRQFCRRITERLRAVPGVEGVAYSTFIPLEYGDNSDSELQVEGYAPAPGEPVRIEMSNISPGYFDLLRIPLLAGRDFTDQDEPGTTPVLIVNEAFAHRFFGSASVIGRKVHRAGRVFTIVGLVHDSKYRRLTEGATPWAWASARQLSGGEFWMAFFVRTSRPLHGMLATLGSEAAQVNAATRGSGFMPYQDWLEAALYPQRVAASLVGVVGAISIVLSAIGLYSVLAFSVRQRTHEFGIRIALGARSWRVLATILRQGMALTLGGLAAGVVLSAFALRAASSWVPMLRSGDPEVIGGAILVLIAVTALASYLPARRATKVDPVIALRHE